MFVAHGKNSCIARLTNSPKQPLCSTPWERSLATWIREHTAEHIRNIVCAAADSAHRWKLPCNAGWAPPKQGCQSDQLSSLPVPRVLHRGRSDFGLVMSLRPFHDASMQHSELCWDLTTLFEEDVRQLYKDLAGVLASNPPASQAAGLEGSERPWRLSTGECTSPWMPEERMLTVLANTPASNASRPSTKVRLLLQANPRLSLVDAALEGA